MPEPSKMLTDSRGSRRPLERLRRWWRGQKALGRFAVAAMLVQSALSLYRFHPPERFVNQFTVAFKCIARGWRRVPVQQGVIQRIFHVYLEETEERKVVIKLPRGDNRYSFRFVKAMRCPERFASYQRVLGGIARDPWMAQHCLEVFKIRRDGGYASEYVEGFNLAHLRTKLFDSAVLPEEHRAGLIEALEELLFDLRGYYAEHGQIIGDWPLHNLMFCPKTKRIVNVDAEGFYSFDCPSVENQLPLIEANLSDMIEFLRLLSSEAPEDRKVLSVLTLLNQVRQSGQTYSGLDFLVGYHSLELNGRKFRGQRECQDRLVQVPFDFKNKVVVDLGCNSGGMLHYLAPTIRKGVGFDVNPNCVNAANAIKSLNRTKNLEFYNFDLDRDDHSLLPCFLFNERVDICLVLSVCMWLKEWRAVLRQAASMSDAILFESNGTAGQQAEQVAELRSYFAQCQLISSHSPDDPLQRARSLYLCTRRKTDWLQAETPGKPLEDDFRQAHWIPHPSEAETG